MNPSKLSIGRSKRSFDDQGAEAQNRSQAGKDSLLNTHAGGPWPAGYKLNRRAAGPTPDWLDRFRAIPSSWVSDSLGQSIGTIGLTAYHNDMRLIVAGGAVTVRVRPGDNLMLHKAIEIAERGDVVVVDGGGDISQALIGGNMRLTALRKGIAGFVIDGAIRDLADWAKGEVGVWAKGHTPRGPGKDGPGEVNVPVSVAGLTVSPGDLILGDFDGVVAIPSADLAVLWPLVGKQAEKEAAVRLSNTSGTSDPERFNAILRAKGCPL